MGLLEPVRSLDRLFFCQWASCDKSFGRRSDLKRHRRIHTEERPYGCDAEGCGKKFTQRCALTVHTRTHTGEKPYQCDHAGCGKRFSDSSSRARHRGTHQNITPRTKKHPRRQSGGGTGTLAYRTQASTRHNAPASSAQGRIAETQPAFIRTRDWINYSLPDTIHDYNTSAGEQRMPMAQATLPGIANAAMYFVDEGRNAAIGANSMDLKPSDQGVYQHGVNTRHHPAATDVPMRFNDLHAEGDGRLYATTFLSPANPRTWEAWSGG